MSNSSSNSSSKSFSCADCPAYQTCRRPCAAVESMLAAPDHGRLELPDPAAARELVAMMARARTLLSYRETLPKRQRRVIDLYYNEGMTQLEIARRLGWHRHTVMRMLRDATYLLEREARRPRS